MQKPADGLVLLERLLDKKGLKLTFERRSIYDEVLRMNQHFDADSFCERFKKKGLRVSRATVYRTLPMLLEVGVIQKAAGEGKRDFFERTSKKGHHDHMVCMQCRKVIEFHSDDVEKAQDQACKDFGFKMQFHDHRIFGYCSACQ